eukprot:COSAG01_NODE_81642_length_109_cov_2021.900000_1_plen_30_part_01
MLPKLYNTAKKRCSWSLRLRAAKVPRLEIC